MQVKYIVYQIPGEKTPRVGIWKTDGDILHHVYAREHGIKPNTFSSMGYLNFNPKKKGWEIEHYSLQEPPRSLLEIFRQKKIEKRDKILVRKQIYKTDFLNDPELQIATFQEKMKKQINWKQLIKSFLFRR